MITILKIKSRQFPGMRNISVLLITAVLLAGCNKKTEEAEWGTFQEPIATKPIPEARGAVEMSEVWGREIGDSGEAGYAMLKPAVTEDGVFVSNRAGTVLRLDMASGDTVWRNKLKNKVFAAVGAGEGIVMVSHDHGVVVALNADSGEKVWELEVGRQISAIPAVGRERVVIRTADGMLLGVSAATGEIVWTAQRRVPGLSVHGDSTPLITSDAVITGLANGRLLANSISNGRDYWETDLSFVGGTNELEQLADVDSPPVVLGRQLFTATYQGDLVALDLQTSSILWRQGISTRLPLALAENRIYVTDTLGGVAAVDASSGDVIWAQSAFRGRGISNPIALGHRVLIGDAKGNVYLLSAEDGTLIQTAPFFKAPITSLSPAPAGVIAFSAEGDVVLIRLAGKN